MEEIKEIILEGTLKTKEYTEFRYYSQRRLLLSVIAFFTLLIFVLYLLSTAGLLRSLITSFFCMAIMYIAMRLILLYVSRREFEKDKILQKKMQYIVNEAGIIQKVKDKSRADLNWEDFSLIRELPSSFIIYLSSRKQAFLIPKSFFQSKNKVNAFKMFVQNNLKDKKIIFN